MPIGQLPPPPPNTFETALGDFKVRLFPTFGLGGGADISTLSSPLPKMEWLHCYSYITPPLSGFKDKAYYGFGISVFNL